MTNSTKNESPQESVERYKKPCHACFMKMMLNPHIKMEDLECYQKEEHERRRV